jgi:hypothetical protein
MEPTVYADQSPESPLKARGESEFSHFVHKESFHFSPSPGYIVRFRPDEPAFTIGFQDGNLGFRSKVGREWNLATSPGSIMDLAWRPRNSFLEPHVMFAAKPEGKLLKWTSMDEGNFEVVCLNPANQYMTIDCASSHMLAAGLLPQIELRTLVDYKQL